MATGGLGLVAGSLLLFASALSVYRFNQSEKVTLSPDAWSWIGHVNLQLDPGVMPYGPFLSEANLAESVQAQGSSSEAIQKKPLLKAGHDQIRLSQASPSQAIQRRTAHKVLARAKTLLRGKKLIRRQPKNWVKQEVIDNALAKAGVVKEFSAEPTQFMPAAQPASANLAGAVVPSKELSRSAQPEAASQAELTTLQEMHRLMRGHFLIAMSTQPAMAQNLLAAMAPTSATDPVPATQVEEPTPVRKHRPRHPRKTPSTVPAVVVAKETQVKKSFKSKEMASSAAKVVPVLSLPLISKEAHSESADRLSSSQAAPTEVALSRVAPETGPVGNLDRSSSEGTPSDYSIPELTQAQAQNPRDVAEPNSNLEKTEPSSAEITIKSGGVVREVVVAQAAPGSRKLDYSSLPSVLSNQTDTRHEPARTESSPVFASDYSEGNNTSGAMPTLVNTQVHVRATEAFDWVTPVVNTAAYVLSKGPQDDQAGWAYVRAAEHWPTLARRNGQSIPLISNNTGKLLSALTSAPLQAEAGIVFGKVPSGWGVRLSGRSEKPVFLNGQNQSISASSIEGERYFAFVNTAPGAHLLYLTNSFGAEEGAVGVAVLSGMATYIDFSAAKKITVSGRVFDGSDSRTRPMSKVNVRVLGSVSAHTETDSTGRFNIDNVLAVADYPIYLETDAPNGYTHRYQIPPTQAKSVILYRLNEAAIQTFLGQLEGTVSPDSGLILSALPNLTAAQNGKNKLKPSVQSLAANPTLTPELYTITSAGQMQVGKPLEAQTTRFLSLQVPEGPAITGVVDAQDKLVWSEMIMVSPAVINLIGPY